MILWKISVVVSRSWLGSVVVSRSWLESCFRSCLRSLSWSGSLVRSRFRVTPRVI